MLIGVFKSNQKLINGLTVLLLSLLWIPAFFLDNGTHGLISTGVWWLDLFLMIFLLACQSIYLNYLASEYKLVKDNSHLTSLIYVILNSCFLWFFELNAVVIANTFVLIALHQLFRIYGTKNHFSLSFGTGLLLGLAGLIYFPMFAYFILLWAFLIYTTTPTWRDFFVSLIGLSLPIVYYIVYKFVFGDLLMLNLSDYLNQIFVINWETFTAFNQLFLIGLLLIFGFALLKLVAVINSSVVKTSKLLIMAVLMLVLGFGSLFLNQYDFLATFLMTSIPVAIIIANFFQNLKKVWLAEVLFLCLMILMILGYFS